MYVGNNQVFHLAIVQHLVERTIVELMQKKVDRRARQGIGDTHVDQVRIGLGPTRFVQAQTRLRKSQKPSV